MPVTVEKTGGFAGVTEKITIDESGKWTKGQASGRLTVEKSQQLQELAANPKLAAEATQTRPQTQCRDAFEYSVTAGKTTVRYVDCSTDGPLPETASKIVELVNEAIS